MARHPRACLGGEHFLVVWRQAQLYSLPVPRSWPLEKPKADQTSTRATAALLRFAAAAEILETDFWVQYNELAGIQDSEEPSGTGNQPYHDAVAQLDEDMDQYIHDNTEMSGPISLS